MLLYSRNSDKILPTDYGEFLDTHFNSVCFITESFPEYNYAVISFRKLLESSPFVMTMPRNHNYDEDKIKSLSSLEHIRKRTGMYIGRIGDGKDYDDGIYILLKEIVDNAVDEFIMGYGDRIAITMDGTRITVRDFGRGIPLGKVIECVSRINTGAKYSDEVFQFSVGLNGIGAKAVNALSSHFILPGTGAK